MARPSPLPTAVLVLLTAAASVPAAPASSQEAEEIMNTALERYEERMEGIRTYRVRQEVMGFTTTNRFVKKTVDGHPVFVQAGSDSAADRMPRGWGNPYRLFPQLAGRARLAGRAAVDGEEVWHLVVDDFRGLELEGMTPTRAAGQFRPQRLELFLDTDDSAIRRLKMQGKMVRDTASRPLSMDAGFHDYREVEGMLHPFRVTISVQGMSAAISPEEMERARRQLEQARKRIEQMPEARREAMREMMEGQLEQLRQVVESGRLETEVVVQEVQVNEAATGGGDPDGG